jgi:4-hydroxy-tetrahydrodipicolinate reductase
MTRVGVLGAGGKMGLVVCRGVLDDPDAELVAAVHPSREGEPLGAVLGRADTELTMAGHLQALRDAGAEVAVDFTTPGAVMANVRTVLELGIHVVVGTTGIGPDELDAIRGWCEGGDANAIVAPNFSVGAVVAQRLAEQAARHFPAVEIVELHHDGKLDAPSGTAAATARRLAAARGEAWSGPAGESVPGSRGGEVEGVRVHSVRLPGLVAHQEVLFGAPGQTLSIRHDALDRASYVPGVLLAIREVARRPGLTIGLEPLLGL